MVVVDSKTRCPPTERDSIQISATSAFNICDGLFRMANCLITELPETELRAISYVLNALVTRVDRLLDPNDYDLSLKFGDLSVDADTRCYPGGEDFGTVVALTSTSTNATGSMPTSPPRYRCNTHRTPAQTQAPVPDQDSAPILVLTHGHFPLVLSSRTNVGFPNYTRHPHFVRPGVPGAYHQPPTTSGFDDHAGFYYIVTKGLYVGIFLDWNEVSPWVTSISGSVYRKARGWEEARDLYNARLANSAVQVLP